MMYPFLVISDSFSSTSSIKREARELPDYLRCRIEQNQIFVQKRGGSTDEFWTAMSAMTVFSMAAVIL